MSERKKRGTVKGSVTRIKNRFRDLSERAAGGYTPEIVGHAKLLLAKLEALDADFKTCHLSLIDSIEDEGLLDQEQEILDEHDNVVADLTINLQQLIFSHSPPVDDGLRKISSRRIARIHTNTSNILDSLTATSDDMCLIQLNQDEIKAHKTELSDVRKELMKLDLGDDDELLVDVAMAEKALFNCSLELRRLIQSSQEMNISKSCAGTESNTNKGVKLPRIEVPTFDGNILHWRTFWEQFSVAIHNHDNNYI